MSSFIIDPYRFDSNAGTFGAVGTLVNSLGTEVSGGTSTLTNIASGDLVLALVARESPTSITGVTCDGTSMTLLRTVTTSLGYDLSAWGWIADRAIASASVTSSFSNSAAYLVMNSARWSNVSSVTMLASSQNTNDGDGRAGTSPDRKSGSITTAQRALIIGCGHDWNLYLTHTAATGWTKRLDGSGTPLVSPEFILDRVSDAGTFGGATAFSTTSPADSYLSMLLAFPLP
jgi:hypothetical protein